MRSASRPAGIDISRNGRVCAVCRTPVAPAPAPSVSTATMGAAASPICSADCAARLDHARRLNADGSLAGALEILALEILALEVLALEILALEALRSDNVEQDVMTHLDDLRFACLRHG